MSNVEQVQVIQQNEVKKQNTRNGFIELMRFVFSLCVVSHHALFLQNPGHIPFIGGYIAVEYFFILTGFFLAAKAEKAASKECTGGDDDAFKQMVKPIGKIYGYFIVCWLASFFISHIINGNTQIIKIGYDLIRGIPQMLLLSLTGLGGSSEGLWDYVGTAWYLQALVIAVLVCFPIMCRWKKSFFSCGALILTVLIYGKIMLLCGNLSAVNEESIICKYGILRAIAGLSFGSFCYYLSTLMPKRRLTKKGNGFFSLIQVLLVALTLVLMDHYSGYNDIIEVLLFAAIIIVSFTQETAINKVCSNKVCYWLGHFAGVMFITQSVTYMYPILPYPEDWALRYLAHFGYIIVASFLNMAIVACVKKLFGKVKMTKWIWTPMDSDV